MKDNVLILIIFYLKHNSASSPRLTENRGLVTKTPDSLISERILNGTNATLGAWPWMVEILDAFGHRCGGALISSQHVLTSAQCLTQTFKKSIRVLLGSYSRQQAEKGLEEEIESICMYPQFVKDKFETDIAIVTLKRPVEYTQTILPVCLPDINDNPDCEVPMYVAGWGYTEPIVWKNQFLSEDVDGSHAKEDLMTVNSGSEKKSQEVTEDTTEHFDYDTGVTPGYPFKSKFPDMLQEARVRLIPNEQCDKLYNDSSLHGNIVCAMYDFGSICSGDSGGPLVYKTKDDRWTLMGLITSTVLPCNVTDHPMYFVRIKPFMDNFILPCIQDPSNCTCKPAFDTNLGIYN
ncbi:plasma kallikrein-like [Ixodes scapularis]|uniref:plasma kallikrein-like n=1 Tax=Ixodes scapularis TaxID=6945 RepID=UPI001A9E9E27|nr:plasma kallikrein-like [Ixodes scapularis]